MNAEHYPLIFPVNYGIDRGVIVIRTDEGTKLAAADHANVTFEVDAIDSRTRSGWSVLVRGLAEEVTAEFGTSMIESTHAAVPNRGRRETAAGGCASSRTRSAAGGSFRASCRLPSNQRATSEPERFRRRRACSDGLGRR